MWDFKRCLFDVHGRQSWEKAGMSCLGSPTSKRQQTMNEEASKRWQASSMAALKWHVAWHGTRKRVLGRVPFNSKRKEASAAGRMGWQTKGRDGRSWHHLDSRIVRTSKTVTTHKHRSNLERTCTWKAITKRSRLHTGSEEKCQH